MAGKRLDGVPAAADARGRDRTVFTDDVPAGVAQVLAVVLACGLLDLGGAASVPVAAWVVLWVHVAVALTRRGAMGLPETYRAALRARLAVWGLVGAVAAAVASAAGWLAASVPAAQVALTASGVLLLVAAAGAGPGAPRLLPWVAGQWQALALATAAAAGTLMLVLGITAGPSPVPSWRWGLLALVLSSGPLAEARMLHNMALALRRHGALEPSRVLVFRPILMFSGAYALACAAAALVAAAGLVAPVMAQLGAAGGVLVIGSLVRRLGRTTGSSLVVLAAGAAIALGASAWPVLGLAYLLLVADLLALCTNLPRIAVRFLQRPVVRTSAGYPLRHHR